MPNITVTNEVEVKLNDSDKECLAKDLGAKFEQLDKERSVQLQDGKSIKAMIDHELLSKIEFGTEVNTDDMYELRETMRANLRKYIESNLENFTVLAESDSAYEVVEAQKQNLVEIQKKNKIKDEYKKTIDNLLIYGELISFCEWTEEYKNVRRKKDMAEMLMGAITGDKKAYTWEQKLVFKGAKVTNIDSPNFVFDTREPDFDKAIKICPRYKTYNQIKAEKTYTLPKEFIEDYKDTNLLTTSSTNKQYLNEQYEDDEERKKKEAGIEVLECWGDFVYKKEDGTNVELNNYMAVVVDRKYIVRIEPNPYGQNPFSMRIPIKNYTHGRGVSPLRVAVSHSLVCSYILTRLLRCMEYVYNPMWYGSKEALTGNIEGTPGKYIGFDNWDDPNSRPQPFQVNMNFMQGFQFLEKEKAIAQATTGIFPYMSGIQDTTGRTATESGILANGQQVRIMMLLDEIQDFQLDNIRKQADLDANFNFEEVNIIKDKGNMKESITINSQTRQDDYSYDYVDRRSYTEKKQDMDEFVIGLEKFAQAGAKINIDYALEEWLKMQEKKNVENYIMKDPIQEMMDANGIPPEMQPQFKQMIAQQAQGVINAQQQQVQPPMYPNENPQQVGGVQNVGAYPQG